MAARATSASEGQSVVVGDDGWLFFAPELRHLTAGPFWGEAARGASRAPSAEDADPLPAILDLKAQLDQAGIALVFVPVPAKATIYPEALIESWEARGPPPRIDRVHQEFIAQLEAAGVDVLDLVPDFHAHRQEARGPVYCKQDTHWSGVGIERAAARLAALVRAQPWYGEVAGRGFSHELRDVPVAGDLWRELPEPRPEREVLSLRFVGTAGTAGLEPVAPWRDSPVVLLGDSHNLVFHAGEELHARGAGLPDQLALELGFPVDLVAVRGSGATPSRVNLMRRRDRLQGKRLVIWCLSVREYTEGQGWKRVPIVADEP